MDLLAREVIYQDEPLDLAPREFALLELFLTNSGRVLTRTQLIEHVWHVHFDMETNLLDVYMSKLRTKLARIEADEIRISTVRGVGYRLEK